MQTTHYFTLEDFNTPRDNRTWRVFKDTCPMPATPEWEIENRHKGLWPLLAEFTGPDAGQQAHAMVDRLNQEEWERIQAAGPLTRYRTRHYVCIDETEARRLAGVDDTPWPEVKIAAGVTLLHAVDTWSLWSDGLIDAGGLNLRGGSLAPAAVKLISTVLGADAPYVEGGILKLAGIAEILSEETLELGEDRGHYARERIERIRVRNTDGTQGEWYAHTAGYFEGYQYDLYASLDTLHAQAAPAPGPEGLTEFPPDDFDYDSDLGYVSRRSE